jgi:hypothetical protein
MIVSNSFQLQPVTASADAPPARRLPQPGVVVSGTLGRMGRIVEVRYRGRLGNQLFQYAFGRLLAEQLRGTFVAPPIDGFPEARARRPPLFMRRSRPSVTVKGHWLSQRRRAALRTERHIELFGFFQRVEYYREHRERIADWFSRPRQAPLPERSLTIHLRSGLWSDGGKKHPGYPALPISYYRRILDERQWSAVYLVCERADDPIATQLLAIPGVQHEERSYLDDFDFLLASRNIALSVSSFGWWPAWLSDAETIFYPLAGIFDPGWVGPKKRDGRIDLAPGGDARYRFVKVVTPTIWRGDAEDRRRVLST